MERIGKLIFLLVIFVALAAATFVLWQNQYINYAIISGTFSLIMAVILVNTFLSTRNEETMYLSKVKQILRTYDAVLVKSNNLPKLKDKNIIRVDSIEDLVDAQIEIRKPIYYQEQTDSCSFVLLDNNEACVYIIKQNEQVTCPLEITISEIEFQHKKEQQKDNTPEDILSGIESTTIVKLDNNKYVKVSPLKKNKDSEPEVEKQEQRVEENTDNISQDVEQPRIQEITDEDVFNYAPTNQNSVENKSSASQEVEVLDF